MGELVEDRVYNDRAGADVLYLATRTGVARVAVAHGRVGRFSLAHRCDARAIAAGRVSTADGAPRSDDAEPAALVAAGVDGDVLVAVDEDGEDGSWTATGFGTAEAVGVDRTEDGPAVLAADPDEHAVGRLLDPRGRPTDWLAVADVDAAVRAIDGPFLAAADGCYRATADGIDAAGLDDVRDVAALRAAGETADEATVTGALAATADGCYRLADDWERVRDGPHDAVAVGPGGVAVLSADGVVALDEGGVGATTEDWPGGWRTVEVPDRPVDVAVGERAYAVSRDGTMLAQEGDGWRTRSLGLPEVRGLCVAWRPATE